MLPMPCHFARSCGAQGDFDSPVLRVHYCSLRSPDQTIDFNMETKQRWGGVWKSGALCGPSLSAAQRTEVKSAGQACQSQQACALHLDPARPVGWLALSPGPHCFEQHPAAADLEPARHDCAAAPA